MGYDIEGLPLRIREQIKAKEAEDTHSPSGRYLVGIDPGTKTGLSVYDRKTRELVEVESGMIIAMYHLLMKWNKKGVRLVRIEDARKRKWYSEQSNAKAQGAGSVKRDSKIWEEICKYHGIPYEMVHPVKGATKWDKDMFRKVTGWEERTNSHMRDSALLVFGK